MRLEGPGLGTNSLGGKKSCWGVKLKSWFLSCFILIFSYFNACFIFILSNFKAPLAEAPYSGNRPTGWKPALLSWKTEFLNMFTCVCVLLSCVLILRSAQFEHTVVITCDGVEILTKLPDEDWLDKNHGTSWSVTCDLEVFRITSCYLNKCVS